MSNLFHSSSRSKRHANPDGSLDVHCMDCGTWIGRTFERITRAQCELCRRTFNGEPITEESVKAYNLAKQGREDVSMLILPEETPHALGKKFSLRSMAGDVMQALGLKAPSTPPPQSKRVADAKKRKRLFESVTLGSIDSVDAQLNKDKDRT